MYYQFILSTNSVYNLPKISATRVFWVLTTAYLRSNATKSTTTKNQKERKKRENSAKMMHMTFYWSTKATLLFDSWKTDSWTSYIPSLLACLIVSIFYQLLENRRIRLKLLASGKPFPDQIEAPLLRRTFAGSGAKLGVRVAGAVLFGLSSAIGYFLMLAVMSFNGGVFIAIVVGLAVGYLLFRSDGEDSVMVDSSCACA